MKQSKPFRNKILMIFLVGYSCIIGALLAYSYYLDYSYNQSLVQTGDAMLNLYVSEPDDLMGKHEGSSWLSGFDVCYGDRYDYEYNNNNIVCVSAIQKGPSV